MYLAWANETGKDLEGVQVRLSWRTARPTSIPGRSPRSQFTWT